MIRPHLLAVGVLVAGLEAAPCSAHCDTTQGPVIVAARSALQAGDPNLVLHWVRPEDEVAVRDAFKQTTAVRALGPEARALADRQFFETLVRIHRAGEGFPFTGLSDEAPEPFITAVDQALETGSSAELERLLVTAVQGGLNEKFAAARNAKDFTPGDVTAGRRFVSAYVPLTHWVEGVLGAAQAGGEHHGGEAGHAAPPAVVSHHGESPSATADDVASRPHAESQRPLLVVTIALAVVVCLQWLLLLRRKHGAPRWLKEAKQ